MPESHISDRSHASTAGNSQTLLSAAAATGAGAAVACSAKDKVAHVFGTFVGTVHLEGSMDGTNYFTLGNLTAIGKIANSEPWKFIRGNVTAFTSGTITMLLGS